MGQKWHLMCPVKLQDIEDKYIRRQWSKRFLYMYSLDIDEIVCNCISYSNFKLYMLHYKHKDYCHLSQLSKLLCETHMTMLPSQRIVTKIALHQAANLRHWSACNVVGCNLKKRHYFKHNYNTTAPAKPKLTERRRKKTSHQRFYEWAMRKNCCEFQGQTFFTQTGQGKSFGT